MVKLLLAEDEEMLAQAIIYAVDREGISVVHAYDGAEALQFLETEKFDMVILDVNMPKVDGLTLARHIRHHQPYLPILMLTALRSETNVLAGFDAGADDYLTKPFSYKELLVRIKALLRRSGNPGQPPLSPPGLEPLMVIGRLKIDPNQYMAWLEGESILLTLTEFRILLYLARNTGRACQAKEIVEAVQGYQVEDLEARELLRVHIQHIRKKMKTQPGNVEHIENVYGVGYTLRA